MLPTGYAFNLGGLALSLPISTLFIAQVYQVPLSFGRLLSLVAIMLVTSKGAAGSNGSRIYRAGYNDRRVRRFAD